MATQNNGTNPAGGTEKGPGKHSNGNRNMAYKDKTHKYSLRFDAASVLAEDVDLGPPDGSEAPEEDENITDYYKALQYILFENNMRETEDRTSRPRTHFTEDDVTMAILSSPAECISILLNGGNKSHGNMLLIMSVTWLEKRPSRLDPKLYSLYVHKGITFDAAGRTFVDVFKPARRVTYFMNFFTDAVTMDYRDDGEDIEVGLDCPMSSSVPLLQYTNNKLWTRLLIAKHCPSCYYPETLAFIYKPHLEYAEDAENVTVIKLDSKEGLEGVVKEKVDDFLETLKDKDYSTVVIKTSSAILTSAPPLFAVMTDRHAICEALVNALQQASDGDRVLVETFYDTKIKLKDAANQPVRKKPRHTMEKYSFRLRATCCRGFGNRPVCSMFICGVGRKSEQIKGGNMVSQSLDTTLAQYGLDEDERDAIVSSTKKSAEELLFAIMEQEKNMTPEERGAPGAQTDLLGIDFVLGKKEEEYVPVIIEVDGHDCIISNQRYDFMNPYLQGRSVGPFVDTMIERSLRHIMTGKRILVIGAGGTSKYFVWDGAKDYSIKVILVDDAEDCPAATKVEKFFYYNYTNHREDAAHAKGIADMIRSQGLNVAGCCTLWEDCGPLAAMVNDQLGLSGVGTTGACIAKSKSLTQSTLYEKDEDIPHFPTSNVYASRNRHISSIEDIEPALEFVGLPAVIKLEYGSSAVGTYIVNDVKQCKDVYEEVQSSLKNEADHPGIGLGHGNTMMIMEYLDGTEHDIDIIVYKRRLIAAFVSDNGPTRDGSFTETAACMPSCLPEDRKYQLITAAYQCVTEIGLSNGVFNVEMMLTNTGPKLIEINGRMGGFYLRDWIKRCYKVDLLLCVFMVCSGVRPYIPTTRPKCQITGIMTIPSAHSHLFRNPEKLAKIEEYVSKGIAFKNTIESEFEDSEDAYAHEEPICNIAVTSENISTAKVELLKVCKELGIDNENYDVEDLLSDFKQYRTIILTD